MLFLFLLLDNKKSLRGNDFSFLGSYIVCNNLRPLGQMLVRGAQTGPGLRRFSLEISRWDFQGEDVILFSGAVPKHVEANNKPHQ